MGMSNRMKGHALAAEGAPHDLSGRRLSTIYGGVSGVGAALCSCGALSDVLDSANVRKAWHRKHKEQLRKESKA